MGLDIRAFSKVQRIEPQPDYEDAPPGVAHLSCTHADFIDRTGGLESGYYTFDKDFGFAAGSYGGYNEWRNDLAKLAGYPAVRHESSYKPPEDLYAAGAWEAKEGPFWELINFADNEGVIGSVVAAKLAKDFAEFQSKADTHSLDWFRRKYADWRKAFELAANGGAVDFH